MKKLRKAFMCLAMVCVCFFGILLSGCNENPMVISIEKTKAVGNVDTYTITYSDDSTFEFTVTNGVNGENGNDVSVQELYDYYKEVYDSDLSYDEFLKLYLKTNETGTTSAVNKALQSSLKVYTEFYETVYTSNGFMNYATKVNSVYQGSAVIWSVKADYTYMVTNYHVVYSSAANGDNGGNMARLINVYLYGSEGVPVEGDPVEVSGTEYKSYNYGELALQAEYVGGTVEKDIAVVRVETDELLAINPNAKAVELAETYFVGENAIAVGNTEGEGISATRGIVSVDSEYVQLEIDKVRSYRLLRIDTAIYAGNSGGGLFNGDGKLIGITNSGNGQDQNINYAIPIDTVRSTVENLLTYCDAENKTIKKVVLGFTLKEENSKFVYDGTKVGGKIVADIILTEVVEDSIIETLGLEVGDKIVECKINQKTITLNRMFNIEAIVLDLRAGDELSFVYNRGGGNITTQIYEILPGDIA